MGISKRNKLVSPHCWHWWLMRKMEFWKIKLIRGLFRCRAWSWAPAIQFAACSNTSSCYTFLKIKTVLKRMSRAWNTHFSASYNATTSHSHLPTLTSKEGWILSWHLTKATEKSLANRSSAYPLLSTGWEPIISGAIGSLYIAMVPSTVTDTFIPKDRGTAREGKKKKKGTR